MKKLQQFIENLRLELGAEQVAVLLYSGSNSDRQAQLFTAGDGSPVPELATVETAEHLINGALSSQKVEMFRSADAGGWLICVPLHEHLRDAEKPERRHRPISEPGYWLGIRGVSDESYLKSKFNLIATGLRLAAQVYALTIWRADPVTGLPDRGEYERVVDQHLKTAGQHGLDLGLLLLQPKTLTARREASNWSELLAHSRQTVQALLRDTDQLYRYSDTIFALPLPGAEASGVDTLSSKLLLGLGTPHNNRADQLHWSVAAIHCTAAQAAKLRSVDCARTLEAALRRCQIRSGDRREFISGTELLDPAGAPQLEGIFTGEAVRDYRNMQLLWEVVEQIGQRTNAAELSIDIVALISAAMDMPVGLFERRRTQSLELMASSGNLPGDAEALTELASNATQNGDNAVRSIHNIDCHAFPAKTTLTAPLVLVMADKIQSLTQSDQRLLSSLTNQLAVAIERLKISEQETGLRESETRHLRQQVSALSQHVSAPEPIFASSAMQQVLRQAKAWSPTDETILITGESGAGKDIMAARLHSLSKRADAPMVTVDCAAIPGTLLEAELFGKVKGAYTGADSASEGYARKAHGGTLFLDEIGELPIEVQAKLLRFVQERQVSPVGSTEMYQVDVRIIAATNRNLAQEVQAGRFRGDLMYRLQVLELHLPPLRQRVQDIAPLAQYFLDSYNQQYERNCRLADAATDRLCSYAWPGNVRELKHSMLKACLECTDDLITPADIGFSESMQSGMADSQHTDPNKRDVANAHPNHQSTTDTPAVQGPSSDLPANSLSASWAELQQSLTTCTTTAVTEQLRLPFGTWVTQALVRSADEQSKGVAKHGAAMLGMPESTYRRQLERIKQADQSGLAVQHALFEPNVPLLRELLRLTTQSQAQQKQLATATPVSSLVAPVSSLVDSARVMLLGIVAELLPEQSSFGAALMGITPPTYRRHLQELKERTS